MWPPLFCWMFPGALFAKGHDPFDSFFGRNDRIFVVDVDQLVAIVAHVQFFHVGELTKPMARFDAFDQSRTVFVFHRVDKVDAGLVKSEDVM